MKIPLKMKNMVYCIRIVKMIMVEGMYQHSLLKNRGCTRDKFEQIMVEIKNIMLLKSYCAQTQYIGFKEYISCSSTLYCVKMKKHF